MANKKINELLSRTPSLTDLMLIGDPSSGYSYKTTVNDIALEVENIVAGSYVTLATAQTISGAKTFSNVLTLTSVANSSVDTDKFLVLTASNTVNYRTGAEVLSDIGGASASSISGTTNYVAKFTSSSAVGNSIIFDNGTNVGVGTTSPSYKLDVSGTLRSTDSSYFATSSGNIGIGTNSVTGIGGPILHIHAPTYPEIHLTNSTTGNQFQDGTSIHVNSSSLNILNYESGSINFSTSGTQRVSIASDGNVTLSVIPNATTDTDKFLVSDSGVIKYRTGAELLSDIGGASSTAISGTTNYIPKFTSATAIGNSVIYESSSNIGIGITSPSARLHVNGTGRFEGSVYAAEAYLSSPNSIVGIIDSTNANGGYLQFSTSSTVIAEMGASQSVIGSGGNDLFVINGKGARDLILATNATERVRIASTGAVTLSTIANATTDTDKFLVSDSGVIKYRTGAELLSDIGGASSSSVSGTTNYIPKFTSSSAIGNSVIYESSSNVGIGTTSPSNILTVAGAAGAAYVRVEATDATLTAKLQARTATSAIELGAVSNSPVAFVTNDTERMRITSGGDVGIGLTSPASSLDVLQEIRVSYANANQYRVRIYNTDGNGRIFVDGSETSLIFGTSPVGTNATATEKMRITSGGQVGIGTTSPLAGYKLDVKGLVRFGNDANANVLQMGDLDANSTYIQSVSTGGVARNLVFYNTGETMRITSGGEVLINTTTDAGDYKLQVNGNSYVNGVVFAKDGLVSDKGASNSLAVGSHMALSNPANSYQYLLQLNGSYGLDFWNYDGTWSVKATLTSGGNLELTGSIKTAAPSGYTAKPWKLGDVTVTSITVDTDKYISVDINGTVYNIPTCHPN